jgi:DNA-binding FadR family transcriptional regulator
VICPRWTSARRCCAEVQRTTVRHVLAVRTSLERDAAVAAALNRTDADVAAIRAAADARRVACDDPDRARFVAADVAFHVRVHVHVRC